MPSTVRSTGMGLVVVDVNDFCANISVRYNRVLDLTDTKKFNKGIVFTHAFAQCELFLKVYLH